MTTLPSMAAPGTRVVDELRRLRRFPGVTGTVAASVDGLVLAAEIGSTDPGPFAALMASTFALAERLATLTSSTTIQELVVRTDGGYVVLNAVNEFTVMAVIGDLSLNLGRIKIELRDAIAAIGDQP